MMLKSQKQKDALTVSFVLEKTTPAYVNALRRYATQYVPTLAIEDIDIVKNTSALYDEVLSHRLGLIPLTTDLSAYTLPEGEVTAANSVALTLVVNKKGMVYSKDFNTKDPKVKPAYESIQVAYLGDGQELELSMLAVMGQGKEHAKWSPCNAFYSYETEIVVNNNSAPKLKEFIKKYPPQIVKGGKIDKDSINTPELVDACDGVCDDIVKVKYNDENFVFVIEGFGQLSPVEILAEATKQFNAQLDEVKSVIKDIKN
jgi:DNA-directed RNA polymerase subunit D